MVELYLNSCIGIRSIVCKNNQELIDLEKLFYKLTGTNNILHKIDSSKKDVEVMLSNIKGDWTWQDGYGGNYFQRKYTGNLPSITFQELVNSELIIPIW